MKIVINETALFRKQFGITQEEMAAYLGVSYSALAMYESGERLLATKPLIKFAELYIAYESAKKSRQVGKTPAGLQLQLDEQHEEAIKKMQYIITDHGKRISRLQYRLEKLTGKHEGAADRLQLFEGVMAALPKTKGTKHKAGDLEDIHRKACKAILENNQQKLRMELDIALLEAEVEVYKAQLLKLREATGL